MTPVPGSAAWPVKLPSGKETVGVSTFGLKFTTELAALTLTTLLKFAPNSPSLKFPTAPDRFETFPVVAGATYNEPTALVSFANPAG